MPLPLGPELAATAATGVLTLSLTLAPLVARAAVPGGLWYGLSNRDGESPEPAWGKRAHRAHANALENLAVFAAVAIPVALTGRGDPTSALACKAFVACRAGHAASYLAGVTVIRTAFHMGGVAATLAVASRLLGAAPMP